MPWPGIDLKVQLWGYGPLTPLGVVDVFDVTARTQSVQLAAGRSDELSSFAAASCTLVLHNGDRRFDPTLTEVVLHAPGVNTATATTPDDAMLAPADLDVRWCGTLDNWAPGGFGVFLAGQWPNVAGNNGWSLGITPAGVPTVSWSTDGTTTVTRTASSWPVPPAGADQCLRVTVTVDDGAGNHVARFWSSDDAGLTWSLRQAVTAAGTTSIHHSGVPLTIGGVLPFAGQCRWLDYRTRVDGPRRAYPRFDRQEPGTVTFTDGTGHTWAVNGTASIGYDDDASPLASVLQPGRKVVVLATYDGDDHFLFSGWIDDWGVAWAKTTGTVTVTAYDFASVLANVTVSDLGFRLDVDRLDAGYLGGDLGEQLTGERVETLLSMAGFGPAQFRAIDLGTITMPATEWRGDILTACQAAEQAEAGFFYVDGAGVIRFLDAHARTRNPRLATTQLTLRDGDYSGFDSGLGLARVWNDVTFNRPDGEPQPVRDDASIARYGHRTRSEAIEVRSDGEAYARAQFFVDRFGRPRRRPGAITVQPAAEARRSRLFGKVAGLQLLDRVVVEQTPVGTGPTARFVGLVEQVTHDITQDDWVTTIALSDADVDDNPGYFTVGDPELGLLDGYPIAY